jgi:hypothetical protein
MSTIFKGLYYNVVDHFKILDLSLGIIDKDYRLTLLWMVHQ